VTYDGRQRGSITPFVVIISFAILLLAGLVVDGGGQLNGHGRAIAYAQEAARAGAQGLNLSDSRLDLDYALATRLANTYCGQAMAMDSELVGCHARIIEVSDKTSVHKAVEVDTRISVPTIMLSIIGVRSLRASGEALASPLPGITGPNDNLVPTAAPSLDLPTGGAAPPTAVSGGTHTIGACPTAKGPSKHHHPKGGCPTRTG
jgi:hypothetical protein